MWDVELSSAKPLHILQVSDVGWDVLPAQTPRAPSISSPQIAGARKLSQRALCSIMRPHLSSKMDARQSKRADERHLKGFNMTGSPASRSLFQLRSHEATSHAGLVVIGLFDLYLLCHHS